MYAVIFRAEIDRLDDDYLETARSMRERAIERYGCKDFVSLTEGDVEIGISYWEEERQIAAWKRDAEHLLAQQRGRSRWYRSYRVEVSKIERSYGSAAHDEPASGA